MNLKRGMKLISIDKIASPTGVKGIKKYTERDNGKSLWNSSNSMRTRFKKGAPVHVKAAISYNDLLKYFKRDNKYGFINNGDKIRWVYLKTNSFGFETMAYKGHEDPPEILQFVRDNIDIEKVYEQALKKKIQMVYSALGWAQPVDTEQTIERFF